MTGVLSILRPLAALVCALTVFVAGCSADQDPQDVAEATWREHVRDQTASLVSKGDGLVNARGAAFVSSGCGAPEREGDHTLYGCAVSFEDGSAWGGVVRVNDDGSSSVAHALHLLADDASP